jgi:hypothetical protein
MSMDPWLAQVYGTAGGEAATDLEKTAQAMFLQKLSAQENIDINQLSPEQQEQLVQQILMGQQAQPQQPQGQPQQAAPQGQPQPQGDPSQMDPAQVQELMMKEAQAKFEEADFLGRAMAHAYVNELEKIAEEGKLPAFMQGSGTTGTDKSSKTSAEPTKSSKEKSKSDKTEKSGTTKTAALIEKLAEARAAEILVANGINPETGAPIEAQTEPPAPQGDAEQQVQAVVDQKAVEMLKAAGYTFEE